MKDAALRATLHLRSNDGFNRGQWEQSVTENSESLGEEKAMSTDTRKREMRRRNSQGRAQWT